MCVQKYKSKTVNEIHKTRLAVLIFPTMAALRPTSRSLFIFLTLSLLACGSRGELFTAIVHMEGLLHLERELLAGLNEYIVAERARQVWNYF